MSWSFIFLILKQSHELSVTLIKYVTPQCNFRGQLGKKLPNHKEGKLKGPK